MCNKRSSLTSGQQYHYTVIAPNRHQQKSWYQNYCCLGNKSIMLLQNAEGMFFSSAEANKLTGGKFAFQNVSIWHCRYGKKSGFSNTQTNNHQYFCIESNLEPPNELHLSICVTIASGVVNRIMGDRGKKPRNNSNPPRRFYKSKNPYNDIMILSCVLGHSTSMWLHSQHTKNIQLGDIITFGLKQRTASMKRKWAAENSCLCCAHSSRRWLTICHVAKPCPMQIKLNPSVSLSSHRKLNCPTTVSLLFKFPLPGS